MPESRTTITVLEILTRHLKETRQAYYRGVAGVTYEDMRAAAARVLRMRAIYEHQTGRPVTSAPTPKQIAALLRQNL
jgi:hypothetical protein